VRFRQTSAVDEHVIAEFQNRLVLLVLHSGQQAQGHSRRAQFDHAGAAAKSGDIAAGDLETGGMVSAGARIFCPKAALML
jgi:hypothetical protein